MLFTDDITSLQCCMSNIMHCSIVMYGLRTYYSTKLIDDTVDVAAVSSIKTFQSVTWDRVRLATSSDPDMQTLLETIESGMSNNRSELPLSMWEYFPFRDNLHSADGVILYKNRFLVPPSLRQEVLESLHSAHQGASTMTARTDLSVVWPGINPAISKMREYCQHCNRIAPSNPSAPPTPLFDPSYPFQCVCANYFHYKGCNYLLVVDRYSNWPIVIKHAHAGADGLIDCLRRTFVTFGIPDELASDGCPEFTTTSTGKFLNDWGYTIAYHRLLFRIATAMQKLG